jgi:hypothetical protein
MDAKPQSRSWAVAMTLIEETLLVILWRGSGRLDHSPSVRDASHHDIEA